jgi:hypothetical protein
MTWALMGLPDRLSFLAKYTSIEATYLMPLLLRQKALDGISIKKRHEPNLGRKVPLGSSDKVHLTRQTVLGQSFDWHGRSYTSQISLQFWPH